MKTQVIAATVLLAAFATSTASAGHTMLTVTNASAGSIAVGDTLVAGGAIGPAGAGAFVGLAGGRAYAGSVLVDSCGCYKKINVTNRSAGSIAVGKGTAGSVVVAGGFGY